MSKTATTIWSSACEVLQETLSPDVFERWISVILPGELNDGQLQLCVSNDFYFTWLEENYLPLIQDAVRAVSEIEVTVHLKVDRSNQGPARDSERQKISKVDPKSKPKRALQGGMVPGTFLNPKNVFDSFVVGSSNNFAHAASIAVAQSPGRAYNPLFIYGGSGMGKTHLMQAIGNYALQKGKMKVCYLSSETFTNEFIDALQNKQLVQFRKKYRSSDLLLIDDIQFLGGKERFQEEFFHTFNALFDAHRQIVMTCDRPASEIPGLEKRLVSRFEWGLVTELEVPDYETRVAILRKKSKELDIHLDDDIIDFLAKRIQANVRRLEGAMIRTSSYASLTNRKLDIDMAEHLLRDTLEQEQQEVLSLEKIQRAVADYFDLRFSDILSKRRPANIAGPRQIAMYLCRQLTDHSLPSIGEAFGKNHATVLHACRTVDERIKSDPQIRQSTGILMRRLSSR